MDDNDVVIVGGARTPFCEWLGGKRGDGGQGGRLASISAEELGSIAIKGALEKTGTEPSEVDHVIMGHALQTSSQAIFGARRAGILSGIPHQVPMLTINRLCGSGAQSVVSAAQMIMLGEAQTVVAGGMENLSQAPHVLRGMRDTFRLGRPPKEGHELSKDMEDYLFTNLLDMQCGSFMAQTSDELCSRKGVKRQDADAFAVISHTRTASSIDSGLFDEEIVSVETPDGIVGPKDEDHVVRGTNEESLSGLRAAFGPDSLVTAGNASGINDGASALVLANEKQAKKGNPMAKIISYGFGGVEPDEMGLGPIPASKMALKKVGLSIEDLDLVESNEAFAAQACAVNKELGLDEAKVNVNGGAIALGHPVGATGSIIMTKLVHELKRRNGKYGLATMCIGGGQGIAVIIENC